MARTTRRSSRTWVTLVATLAAAASGLVVGSTTAFGAASVAASASPIPEFIFVDGDVPRGGDTLNEGDSTGTLVVGRFFDTGAGATCDKERFSAKIDWGDKTTPSDGTVTCALAAPPVLAISVTLVPRYSVTGSHTYADSGTYDITLSVTDTTDSKSDSKKTDSATVADKSIESDSDLGSVRGVEGTYEITAFFFDNNGAYSREGKVDPGITATIDWGDGSTSSVKPTPVLSGNFRDDFQVKATHSYDARLHPDENGESFYDITVTVTDDGGQSQIDENMGATITDGNLTAGSEKSISATQGSLFSAAVASFTDAAGAQASASDFKAMINWGDGGSSVGTVSKTGDGAFDVNGGHGYATTGTKSITVTVTDEEGQSTTLHAKATVNAAPAPAVTPAALPTTGQPRPTSAPLPLLALLLLGVMAVLGVAGTLVLRRTNR